MRYRRRKPARRSPRRNDFLHYARELYPMPFSPVEVASHFRVVVETARSHLRELEKKELIEKTRVEGITDMRFAFYRAVPLPPETFITCPGCKNTCSTVDLERKWLQHFTYADEEKNLLCMECGRTLCKDCQTPLKAVDIDNPELEYDHVITYCPKCRGELKNVENLKQC